jgi:septal ring factor EnvC (AmiA/AmiB activator)
MVRVVLISIILALTYSCVVQIEEKPPRKQAPAIKREKVRIKPKKERSERRKEKPARKKVITYLSPLKGKVHREGRGYFISSSCKKFFRAVEAGKAIYVGRDLKAYGWTVIVEQRDGFISVYTRTGELFVSQGEKIRKRQVLGRVGRKKGRCGIYFEVRDGKGRPVKVRLR